MRYHYICGNHEVKLAEISSKIVTLTWKNPDTNGLTEFEVVCCPTDNNDDPIISAKIASLRGWALDLGYYPRPGDGVVDLFDMRSGHAEEVFGILTEKRAAIQRHMPDIEFETLGRFIHLEELAVDERSRGRQLGLRLIREAQSMFARYDTIAIVKAHPSIGEASGDDCRRLASYYASDPATRFVPVSYCSLPGWLVAHWDEAAVNDGDTSVWSADDAGRPRADF